MIINYTYTMRKGGERTLGHRQQIQKKFITYTQSLLNQDDKIDELIDWENKEEILKWLDSL
ncbi:MAG: hypothetical protein GY799_04615 [Desulfobulbaceae bacterium]|nr:hypothetical protein [Desulfobulbaceae bacterium]